MNHLTRIPTTDSAVAVTNGGPLRPSKREHSSRNATKHGIFAKSLESTLKILGESPREYRQFIRDIKMSLDAQGAFEICLAEKIATDLWRLQRLNRFEAIQLVGGIEPSQEYMYTPPSVYEILSRGPDVQKEYFLFGVKGLKRWDRLRSILHTLRQIASGEYDLCHDKIGLQALANPELPLVLRSKVGAPTPEHEQMIAVILELDSALRKELEALAFSRLVVEAQSLIEEIGPHEDWSIVLGVESPVTEDQRTELVTKHAGSIDRSLVASLAMLRDAQRNRIR